MSERTAIRMDRQSTSRPAHHGRRSASAGIARVGRRCRARWPCTTTRPMPVEAGRRVTGSSSSVPPPSAATARSAAAQLVLEVAALPGDQEAARPEQREGQLDELGRGSPPRAPSPPASGRGGARPRQGPRPGRRRPSTVSCEAGRRRPTVAGSAPSCRSARRAGPASPAGRRPAAAPGSRRRSPGPRTARSPRSRRSGSGGQAVDDVAAGDRRRVADGGQVDRLVPGQQQPDVAVDRRARARGQGQARGPPGPRRGRRRRPAGRCGVSSTRVGSGSRGLSTARLHGRVPSVHAAPLPASARLAPQARLRSSPVRPVRGRVSPCPSRTALPSGRPQCGCRTVERPDGPRQRGFSTNWARGRTIGG